MPLSQWSTEKINLFKEQTGQALLSDEQTLVSFSQDFGKLFQSSPFAVCTPQNDDELQALIVFAYEHQLPVTIRANGLSQFGQSLPIFGGLTISMQHFSKTLDFEGEDLWVEANASWKEVIAKAQTRNLVPFVLPYNCNLSVGGILSVGGVGASSFKYGTISAHVKALEVIDGLGVKHRVGRDSELFHACLSGQGQFAVMTKVCVELKPVNSRVKTISLVYADQKNWFEDMQKAKKLVDYMETICSPSIQGTRLQGNQRIPMAQWLYGLHLSFVCETKDSEFKEVLKHFKPWKVLNTQEEALSSYLLRHDTRFEVMKMLGQWDLYHPWYECFISIEQLKKYLPKLLETLPIHYASLVHIVPIAKKPVGFLMLPEDDPICSFMILNPGVPLALKDSCVQVVEDLDQLFLSLGGKRYLSGCLGKSVPEKYWSYHYGTHYETWLRLKNQFDPRGIFTSVLFPYESILSDS